MDIHTIDVQELGRLLASIQHRLDMLETAIIPLVLENNKRLSERKES